MRIVVECTVEYTYVFDTVFVNGLKQLADVFNGECRYRFLAAADAKVAGGETSACGFKLHKRFVPIEETAFFGWNESGKV